MNRAGPGAKEAPMSSPHKPRRLAGTVLTALMPTVQAAVPLQAAPVGTDAVGATDFFTFVEPAN